jgi:hypothetical protein
MAKALDKPTVKPSSWDNVKQLTEKQRSLLANQGINPDNLRFSQGKQLVSEIFRRWDRNLCSFKQTKVLRKYALRHKRQLHGGIGDD